MLHPLMRKASFTDDEKKRKLMVVNRASARKSALRKKLYIEALEKENQSLRDENNEMKNKLENYRKMFAVMLGKNTNSHSVINIPSEYIESTMADCL
ncbi:putative bZIP transcription factor [Trachipleistophora hominis]|uniref:Putative bZIP transcription factor n=1 Tax=Trachipleistophora hominis TaxID=72359 RepID=L7JUU9_TRAHO|nr:putative bZIP transcription factor [Trachipleistophora hominis]